MASVSTPALTFEQFMELTKDRRPWPELVDGEIVERPVPNEPHSYIQMMVGYRVISAGLLAFSENHSRLGRNVRIPDVQIRRASGEDYPTKPPLATVEILSPGDSMSRVYRKCLDYEAWGVKNIWLVDPDEKRLLAFRDGTLGPVDAFQLPDYNLHITLADLLPPKSPSPAPQ